MKKSILCSIIIMLSLGLIYPLETFALTNQNYYINKNNIENIEIGSLSFDNITFKDYSSISTKAFGLTGIITNKDSKDINYMATVQYYDANYNLIAQESSKGIAIPGTSNFNQMSNLSILENHSINEIKYYHLSIDAYKYNLSKTTKPSENQQYSSYDYVIDKYDVNIVVNENNTFDITETITAYFNVPKHGIIRTIPLKNKVTRLDGTSSTNRAQVSNLSVDNEYITSKENGNLKIKIGSPNHTLTGEESYVIKYTYNLGKDPIKTYDEFYYNIIGNGWDTVIGNITFTITMPKEFDTSKLGFSSGIFGSTNNTNVKYHISNNKIEGNYEGTLEAGEALTVRCELKEGYFVGAELRVNLSLYIMFIVPIVGLIISLFLWYLYGRDEQIVETVEFYPPENHNSLEIGFLYKGKADNQDVTSLIIDLANKGYISILETEENVSFKKEKGFRITKIKEYDGNNKNEQLFLKGLFSRKHKIDKSKVEEIINQSKQSGKRISYSKAWEQASLMSNEDNISSVTSKELQNNFYITMKEILANINSKENRNKIFEKSTLSKSVVIILLMIATIITTMSIPTLEYAGGEELIMTLVLCAVYFPFYAATLSVQMSWAFRILFFGFMMIHSFLFFSSMPIAEAVTSDFMYLLGVLVGIVCLIGMIVFLKQMPKRTAYGCEILGKIKGFKNFLETAEKEKLEAMVMKNPTYFYDILPYTYVLGISDKWIKKFETIALQEPSWYVSSNNFNIVTFGSFMNSTMVSAKSSMSSSPSSSSSGGSSSGGGSSGGGSGGGGGGSW